MEGPVSQAANREPVRLAMYTAGIEARPEEVARARRLPP